MLKMRMYILAAFVVGGAVIGCGRPSAAMKATWYEEFGWRAEDFFEDPKVIPLCHAIESRNLNEIDRLIAGGANINTKGKDNMTPLLWAFPDKNLACFTRLLELGADPNVEVKSDLNTHGGIAPGDSVTHMACGTEFNGYFEAVFTHSGDPASVFDYWTGGLDTRAKPRSGSHFVTPNLDLIEDAAHVSDRSNAIGQKYAQ